MGRRSYSPGRVFILLIQPLSLFRNPFFEVIMERMKLIFLFLCIFAQSLFAELPERFRHLIQDGDFGEAQQQMRLELAGNPNLSSQLQRCIEFEIERLERIKKDFTKTREQVFDDIRKYIPTVTELDLAGWEQDKSLECMIIDGQKRYFKYAVPNLFRIDRDAKKIKEKSDVKRPQPPAAYNRSQYVTTIVNLATSTGDRYIHPGRFKVRYTLSVDANAVPAGSVIRCWLPFPREIANRQTNVRLIGTEPARYILADNDSYLQRTIYFEKISEADQETFFRVEFEYTAFAVYHEIDPTVVKPAAITAELEPYLQERPPHIVFSPEFRELSKQIVGQEKNPYRIAQKLFCWIDENIPWASAREYSTFENISEYVYQHRHADCGMQTIFFITLCRMNGIPARWQSGWSTEPGDEGMHDWGEIYFEPYGWVPMDVTYGLTASSDEKVKWFYISGMENYRLIVNDDYSQALYPAKIYPRSETIDFQRGEVEWEGGNLYFDQWNYEFDVEVFDDKNESKMH